MKFRVKNFGPIGKANIETKPLTIIIGKNNQGKSYTAELTFALLKLGLFMSSGVGWSIEQKSKDSITLVAHTRPYPYPPIEKLLPEERKPRSITLKKSDFDEYTDQDLAKQIIDNLVSILFSIAESRLQPLLEETFGMDVGTLVNINSLSSSIHLYFSDYMSMSVTISKKGRMGVRSQYKEEELDKLKVDTVPFVSKIRPQFDTMLPKKGARATFPSLLFDMLFFFLEQMVEKWQRDIIYIPAGRAGLIEGYYSVASALTRLASVAPSRGISMPAMPPLASEFYNLMLQFQGKKGKMIKISSELTDDILGGELLLERENKQAGMARIKYRFPKGPTRGTVDIIHAGSMVKELTGLCLVIQEKIEPGTFLIVEEPEAHLHPSAQKKIARIFMKLAANGVETLITTHSDIILREIAHLVGQRQKTKSKDILPANQVSVILLKEGEKGSFSEELKIPASGILDGIPTFDEVITELYEEEIDLESSIGS